MTPRLTADRLRQGGFRGEYRECIFLADPRCAVCHGSGTRTREVCRCVFRSIFRLCWTRYQQFRVFVECGGMSKVWVTSGMNCCLPMSEYIADFETVCAQWLEEQGATTRAQIMRLIFAEYMILGLAWQQSYRRALRIDKKLPPYRWWQYVTAMQEGMGHALKGVKPYPLHPVGEYLHNQRSPLLDLTQIARPTRRRPICA